MTYPPVVLPGELTADDLNAGFLIGRQVFFAFRDATQTISSSSAGITANALQWDDVVLDLLDAWDPGSPTRFTPPVVGWYALEGSVSFAASTAGTSRGATWRVNGSILTGSTSEPHASSSIANTPLTADARDLPVFLDGTDYVELCPFQNSGGTLSTVASSRTPFMSVTYRGPV